MLRRTAFIVFALFLLAALLFAVFFRVGEGAQPIRVGVMHALSGTMAISETALVDATLLAIDEINAGGGLNGRQIEPIVIDTRSDWAFARDAARDLITTQRVDAVFGCWTSACRRTVRPVFESLDHLLIYPVQYEGLEESPNILYTGAAPNQQIIPAVKWAMDNLGRRFFLVGSDYVFPRSANAIIRDQVASLRGEIVGEEYRGLGAVDFEAIVARIIEMQPDAILNTINGDSNIAFFSALRAAGVTPADIPTISFSIAESELPALEIDNVVGDYAAWNYFQSVEGAANRRFVEAFRARYGADRVTSDPIEAAYFGVHLWAGAVRDARTAEVRAVRLALRAQSMRAPGGVVSVDAATNHVWKTVHIGRIRQDGQFDIVWTSGNPIRPQPFPIYRSVRAWEAFLNDLYIEWGGAWANPGAPDA